jgi:hypothetical protein
MPALLMKELACPKVFSNRRTIAAYWATFFIDLSTEKSNRFVGTQERIYERIDAIYYESLNGIVITWRGDVISQNKSQ